MDQALLDQRLLSVEGFIRLDREAEFPLPVLAFKSNYEDDMTVDQLHSSEDVV